MPEQKVYTWEQADALAGEYWDTKWAERMALDRIVWAIQDGSMDQAGYDVAKLETDALQDRIAELEEIFEKAVVLVAPDDDLWQIKPFLQMQHNTKN
jgi:transcription elongation GreA/GreB family factor